MFWGRGGTGGGGQEGKKGFFVVIKGAATWCVKKMGGSGREGQTWWKGGEKGPQLRLHSWGQWPLFGKERGKKSAGPEGRSKKKGRIEKDGKNYMKPSVRTGGKGAKRNN